jgi:hypothetical protein
MAPQFFTPINPENTTGDADQADYADALGLAEDWKRQRR